MKRTLEGHFLPNTKIRSNLSLNLMFRSLHLYCSQQISIITVHFHLPVRKYHKNIVL